MKTRKGWAIINEHGRLDAVAHPAKPCRFPGEHIIRVRIIEDAAVERAIEVLRVDHRRAQARAMNSAGTPRYEEDADKALQIESAIRDLGGKP